MELLKYGSQVSDTKLHLKWSEEINMSGTNDRNKQIIDEFIAINVVKLAAQAVCYVQRMRSRKTLNLRSDTHSKDLLGIFIFI